MPLYTKFWHNNCRLWYWSHCQHLCYQCDHWGAIYGTVLAQPHLPYSWTKPHRHHIVGITKLLRGQTLIQPIGGGGATGSKCSTFLPGWTVILSTHKPPFSSITQVQLPFWTSFTEMFQFSNILVVLILGSTLHPWAMRWWHGRVLN